MKSYKLALSLALPLALLIGASGCSSPAPKTTAKAEEPKTSAPPAYFKVDEKTASTITGKVTFRGKRLAMKVLDLTEDPECAKLHRKPVYDQSFVVGRNGSFSERICLYKKRSRRQKI